MAVFRCVATASWCGERGIAAVRLLTLHQHLHTVGAPVGKQAPANLNDERFELGIAQVFEVKIGCDPLIAVWRRRVTTGPR
jgi:hypothetical protein